MLVAAVLAAGGLWGCDSDDDVEPEPAPPWRYVSDTAPYAIEVPGQWEQRDADEINSFADVALHMQGRFFAIVILEEIPNFEGVKSPGADSLKRASLELLKERVDSFAVEREGPVSVDGQAGLTVFATGLDGQNPVQYITTYLTRGAWGYQVVVWGPKDSEDQLTAATDALMDGWNFRDDSNTGTPSGQPDGRGDGQQAAEPERP
ncbi:MAG: hypothetical protein ACOC9J_02590 [Persicimonas sp.]